MMTLHPDSDTRPNAWRVVLPVALGVSAAPLDSSVNIAMPDITQHFGIAVHSIQWVVICYVLTYSCLLLAFGRLADAIGHRRVFIAGLWVSMAALAACAWATSFEVLLMARVGQGIGTAMVLSVGPALMTLSFPVEERGKVVGQYAFAFALGYALGPFIGGVLVEHWGWPAIYAYRVPILGLAWLLTITSMPSVSLPDKGEHFDIKANLSLTLGMLLVLLFINQSARLGQVNLILAITGLTGAAALVWFVRYQNKSAYPVIDMSLFRQAHFTAVNIGHILVNGSLFMIMLFGPFYVTRAANGNEIVGGIFLGMFPLGTALTSLIANRLLALMGGLVLSRLSLFLVTLGLLSIALWPPQPSYPHLLVTLLLPGLGYGLFQVASLDLVMGTMDRTQQGVAGSLNTVTRTMGVAIGASLGSLLFAQVTAANPGIDSFDIAFELVFGCATAVAAVALLGFLFVKGDTIRTR